MSEDKFKISVPVSLGSHTKDTYITVTMGAVYNDRQIDFKTVLKDEVYNTLIDNGYIPGYESKDVGAYGSGFSKTIKAPTLESLVTRIKIIYSHYEIVKKISETPKNKILCISFSSKSGEASSSWNGVKKGFITNIEFKYFVGYKSVVNYKDYHGEDKSQITYYNDNCEIFNLNYDKIDREYKIIEWTQERENFIVKLAESFETLENNLSEFLKDISQEKFDNIINQMSSIKFLEDNNGK